VLGFAGQGECLIDTGDVITPRDTISANQFRDPQAPSRANSRSTPSRSRSMTSLGGAVRTCTRRAGSLEFAVAR
jgi:hypothetical protein